MEANFEDSLKWYRRAARQGLSRSQVATGMMYLEGLGTEPDEDEALKRLRLAAEQGASVAKELMEEIERWGSPSS